MSNKRALVVGAGPSGLVTLRNLVEYGKFAQVQLVERRDDVGGVWYLDRPDASKSDKPRWPSPAYPGLIGNVLPKFLSFSGHPFPPPADSNQPFPSLTETHEYLKAFAAPYLASGHIKLNSEVVRVEELPDNAGWKVSIKDWNSGGQISDEIWDAVVVAVCWYDNPRWPDTEGLSTLREQGLALHSTSWRGPQGCEGKRVLVLGNANSSNDIATQLVLVAKTPVYRSVRRPPFPGFVSLPDERIIDVPPVEKYTLNPESHKITALLEDGNEITDIDLVQAGTGFRPYPSFLHVLDPSNATVPLMNEKIVPHRVPSLHRLILYAPNPSLAFIGTAAFSYIPFPLADVSSVWLALAWLGEIPYPPTVEERLESETKRLADIARYRAETENPSSLVSYNVLSVYEEEYGAGLKADIVKARPDLKDVLMDWNPEKTEERNNMFVTKRLALEYTKRKREQALAN